MPIQLRVCACLLLSGWPAFAASKPHSVALGKWTTVKLVLADDTDSTVEDLKIRPLIVDGQNKEWITGPVHDVTQRTFVVQRVYRLNDSLPEEPGAVRWRWELGAWLLVDRISAKVQAINFPDFDPYASHVSWFRDYAAYCGSSDDGKKELAILVQLGRRKPLLKKNAGAREPGKNGCPSPKWERTPARATYAPMNQEAFTYTVRTRAVDILSSDEDDQDEQ